MLKEKIEQLIERGERLLNIDDALSTSFGIPIVEEAPFTQWQTQCFAFFDRSIGSSSHYTIQFRQKVNGCYFECIEAGIGILKALYEDADDASFAVSAKENTTPLHTIETVCNRFNKVARQLLYRHDSRATLKIADEYDVQDLMHSLLWLYFDDIREEEYTPSYAGKASRVDFLLIKEKVVLEIKMARPGLLAKELGDQLLLDIARYRAHQSCRILVCFVYDPNNLIRNPRGIESDLSCDDAFPVRVFIRPE